MGISQSKQNSKMSVSIESFHPKVKVFIEKHSEGELRQVFMDFVGPRIGDKAEDAIEFKFDAHKAVFDRMSVADDANQLLPRLPALCEAFTKWCKVHVGAADDMEKVGANYVVGERADMGEVMPLCDKVKNQCMSTYTFKTKNVPKLGCMLNQIGLLNTVQGNKFNTAMKELKTDACGNWTDDDIADELNRHFDTHRFDGGADYTADLQADLSDAQAFKNKLLMARLARTAMRGSGSAGTVMAGTAATSHGPGSAGYFSFTNNHPSNRGGSNKGRGKGKGGARASPYPSPKTIELNMATNGKCINYNTGRCAQGPTCPYGHKHEFFDAHEVQAVCSLPDVSGATKRSLGSFAFQASGSHSGGHGPYFGKGHGGANMMQNPWMHNNTPWAMANQPHAAAAQQLAITQGTGPYNMFPEAWNYSGQPFNMMQAPANVPGAGQAPKK